MGINTLWLYIDWRSATHGALRPAIAPRSWRTDPQTLDTVLEGIRNSLDAFAGDDDVIVDAYIFGGFTGTDGRDSSEFVALTEALSRAAWTGRSPSGKTRFRDLTTVTAPVPDDSSRRLHALFRPRIRVPNPRLKVRGDRCSCRWLKLAEQCLAPRPGGEGLVCPECRTTKLEFEREGQKMVDTLLVTHVVHRAVTAISHNEGGQIWVLSDDSDILPAICTAAALGVTTRWILGRPMTKYGYQEIATSYGIEIREVNRG